MADKARGCLGTVYRVTVEFLAERAVLEDVKAKVSPDTRKLLEKPPFAFAWQEGAPLEEIERVLYTMPKGRELCVDLGHAAGRQLSGSVVKPVLKMAISLFGQTPASLFANLDRFFSMVVRGFNFRYEERAPREGVVYAEIAGGGVHESLFDQLRGNLMTVFDLCSVKGDVGEPQVVRHDDAGAVVGLAVRWDPAEKR
jgi:hypothetical protein